jgi:hypothetical protein
MKINKVYRVQYNVYDIYDIGEYLLEIISEGKVNYPNINMYYKAKFVGTNYIVHFYPNEWSKVQELSSLEQELL